MEILKLYLVQQFVIGSHDKVIGRVQLFNIITACVLSSPPGPCSPVALQRAASVRWESLGWNLSPCTSSSTMPTHPGSYSQSPMSRPCSLQPAFSRFPPCRISVLSLWSAVLTPRIVLGSICLLMPMGTRNWENDHRTTSARRSVGLWVLGHVLNYYLHRDL